MRDQFRMSDTTDELDAIQRRLLELSELFPLTFWKNLDRLNVQEQRTPRWSFLINSNGIQVILLKRLRVSPCLEKALRLRLELQMRLILGRRLRFLPLELCPVKNRFFKNSMARPKPQNRFLDMGTPLTV